MRAFHAKTAFSAALICSLFLGFQNLSAIELTEANFTVVQNQVSVTNEQGKVLRTPRVKDHFSVPEVIVTGPNSRTELLAADNTVTRVGSNTIFSFQPKGRGISLKQGSVLFHSPKGKGGGVIKTNSASASVLGTTIIVSATQNGGFKLLVLEGTAKLGTGGNSITLTAGQLAFILPGSNQPPPVFEFRIGKLVNESKLVNGFPTELASLPKVEGAVNNQEKQIAKGRTTDTGLLLGDVNGNNVQVIDPNTRQGFLTQTQPTPPPTITDDAGNVIPLPVNTLPTVIVSGLNFNDGTSSIDYGFAQAPLDSNLLFLNNTFTADNFSLQANGTIALSANTLNLFHSANIRSFNSDVSFDNVYIRSRGIVAQANGTLSVANNSNFQATVRSTSTINLTTSGAVGYINLTNGTFTANAGITANSSGHLNVDSSTFTSGGTGVNLAAATGPTGGVLSISNSSFNAASVSMAAKTLILTNIDFGNSSTFVYLNSLTGLPSFSNGAAVPGNINFIGSNNRYAGINITSTSSLSTINSNFPGKFNLGSIP